MRVWILALFFFFVACSTVNSHERHVVYMPTFTRKDWNYTIFFLSADTKLSTRVTIYVNNIRKSVHIVKPDKPTLLKTDTLRTGTNMVKLVARGGSTFAKQTKVRSVGVRNKAAIFVQKSKYEYAPGERLTFTCFALNSEFITIDKPINIEIYDTRRTLIQAWYGVKGTHGVITKEMLISKNARTGYWSIVLRQDATKLSDSDYFVVRSNDAKRATVEISGTPDVFTLGLPAKQYSQQMVQLVISAYYEGSRPMKGMLYLKCSTDTDQHYNMTANINGTYVYRFKLDRFLHPPYRARNFYFTATVEDTRTNFYTTSKSHKISMGEYPVRVLKPYLMAQKEGLHQTITLAVRPWLNVKYLSLSESHGALNVTFITRRSILWTSHCATLVGDVIIPIPHAHLHSIIVKYTSHYQKFNYTITSNMKVIQLTPGYPQIQVSMCSNHYYAGDIIHVKIDATVKIKTVYYMVMHEGCLIAAGLVYAYGNQLTVSIKTAISWNPHVRIIFTAVTFTEYTLVDGIVVNLMPRFAYTVDAYYSADIVTSRTWATIKWTAMRHCTLYGIGSAVRYGHLKNKYISMTTIIDKLYNWRFRICGPVYHNVRSVFLSARLDYDTNMFSVPILPEGKYYPCYYDYLWEDDTKPINRRSPFRDPWFRIKYKFQDSTTSKSKIASNKLKLQTNMISSDTKTTNLYGPPNEAKYNIHAFAVNPSNVLSVLEKKHPIQIIPKVWHCFDSPTSAFLGERFDIVIVIYSYLPFDLMVNVVVADRSLICKGSNVKRVMLRRKTYVYVTFKICIRRLGKTTILTKVRTRSRVLSTYLRKLYRKQYGYNVVKTNVRRFNLKWPIYTMAMPKPTEQVVPGTMHTAIYFTGDVMAPILFYIWSLVPPPTYSCEQSISMLSWPVYSYQYIAFRKELGYQKRLRRYMRIGYQDVQRFLDRDGSYGSKSVWLTSMACRTIYFANQNKMGMVIDKKKLEMSFIWLIDKQRRDGSYAESGPIIHQMMQKRIGERSIPLTVDVLLTLTSLRNIRPGKAKRAIFKGILFLKRRYRLNRLKNYELCIMLHLFAKMKMMSYYRKVYRILTKRATKNGNMVYWKGPYRIEQTCHALLAAYYTRRIRGTFILNYLLLKHNMQGGYDNTQNTAVCVEAFSKFGRYLIRVKNANINAFDHHSFNTTYKYRNGKFPLFLNFKWLDINTKEMVFKPITWKGKRQYAVAKLVTMYKTEYPVSDRYFGLSTNVNATSGKHLVIEICYTWKSNYVSGLLITKIQLPAGYIKKNVFCRNQTCNEHEECSRDHTCFTDVVGNENEVAIYIKSMTRNTSFCLSLEASKLYIVQRRQVKMYIETSQYYTGKKIVKFYIA